MGGSETHARMPAVAAVSAPARRRDSLSPQGVIEHGFSLGLAIHHQLLVADLQREYMSTAVSLAASADDKIIVRCKVHIQSEESPGAGTESVFSLRKSDEEQALGLDVVNGRTEFQVTFEGAEKAARPLNVPTRPFIGKPCEFEAALSANYLLVKISSAEAQAVRYLRHDRKSLEGLEDLDLTLAADADGIKVEDFFVTNTAGGAMDAGDIASVFETGGFEEDLGFFHNVREIGKELHEREQYDRALAMYGRVFRAPFEMIAAWASPDLASLCIRKLYNYDRPKHVECWNEMSNTTQKVIGQVCEGFKADADGSHLEAFQSAIEATFDDEGVGYSADDRAKLISAFKALNGKMGAERVPEPDWETPPRILMVAGMVWSGSGAIYDFLKEFEGVKPVVGETKYIRGYSSLIRIYEHLDRPPELREAVIDFFFYTLLGAGRLRNGDDYKTSRFARNNLFGKNRERYLNAVIRWCHLAHLLLNSDGQDQSARFDDLVQHTLVEFCAGGVTKETRFVLLDNVVSIPFVDTGVEFLVNSHIFCCFRDPRSNFVSMKHEFTANLTPKAYVDERRKTLPANREKARIALEKVQSKPDLDIEIVEFEEFVVSKQYREELVRKIGLSQARRKEFEYFKPWESAKNVMLHQFHPNQDEIKYIESELGDYCVDLDIKKHQSSEREKYE